MSSDQKDKFWSCGTDCRSRFECKSRLAVATKELVGRNINSRMLKSLNHSYYCDSVLMSYAEIAAFLVKVDKMSVDNVQAYVSELDPLILIKERRDGTIYVSNARTLSDAIAANPSVKGSTLESVVIDRKGT